MSDEPPTGTRRTITGISVALAVTICILAVQATWNMSNGLSSLRLENQKALSEASAAIAAQGEALRLQIQELRFRFESLSDQVKEIREAQKSHPQEH